MMHALVTLICASVLFLIGIVFDLPSEVKLYLCGTGVAFMYFGIIMCVLHDDRRRGNLK